MQLFNFIQEKFLKHTFSKYILCPCCVIFSCKVTSTGHLQSLYSQFSFVFLLQENEIDCYRVYCDRVAIKYFINSTWTWVECFTDSVVCASVDIYDLVLSEMYVSIQQTSNKLQHQQQQTTEHLNRITDLQRTYH